MLNIEKIVEIINKLGIKTYSFDYNYYSTYIDLWYNWYKGYDASFHTYKDFNGFNNIVVDKAKLCMASQVCRDHSSLTCNENLTINIDGNAEREFILGHDEMTGILGQNDFWSQLAKFYEITCALGTGAFEIVIENMLKFDNKVVINEDSKLKIINHSALEIVPLSWDNNGKIIDVAFVDQYRIKDTDFVDLRIHVLEDDVYNIYNKKLKVFNNSTFEFIKDTSVIDKFYTGSNIPWFSVFKLPIVNNHDTKSPLGISVYGNAIDVLKNIDDAFNALTNEYKHSSKKIFYNKSMLNRDDEGRPIDPDSINKTLFYYVGDTESPSLSEDVPIKEFIPEIRVNKITEGLESALSYLSSLCGLGNNYYKFTGGSVVKTATEVISENSALFRNIKKNEIALEKFLIDFIHSILYVSNYALKTKFDLSTKISIKFDTSIIEDKAAIRDRDLKEVEAGIMTIEEYRNKWYNSARRDTTNNE